MITWHARVYNLRKYRSTTAYCIKLGKSGTRRSPGWTTAPLARPALYDGTRRRA